MLGWGGRVDLRRRETRCAGGAERVGYGVGLAPPQPTRGLGSVVSSPQRGPGRSPGRLQLWYIMGLQNDAGGTKISYFSATSVVINYHIQVVNFCVFT